MEKKTDLQTWLSNKLLSLIGFSNPIIVKYIIGLSKISSSPQNLAEKLSDVGLSPTTNTITFAKEVFLKRKIEALLDEIEFEHQLLDETLLTEKEKRDFKTKEELYSVVKKRPIEEDDVDNYKGYVIPEAYDQEGRINQEKRFSVVKEKYRDDRYGYVKDPRSEQAGWEDAQLKRGEVRFGAKDRKLVICIRMRSLSRE